MYGKLDKSFDMGLLNFFTFLWFIIAMNNLPHLVNFTICNLIQNNPAVTALKIHFEKKEKWNPRNGCDGS